MKREEIRLLGTAEIADLLGVSSARVNQIADSISSDFPRPLARLKAGRIWLAQDIEAWVKEHRPRLDEDTEG